MEKIDFVIMWVDGDDPEWKKEKNKYSGKEKSVYATINESEKCFRDWDILKYWFRGIEKYASWVNKVHFITWGHLPQWLNLEHPKLHVVKHEDFIPNEYLPVFNSRVIETNVHRIVGLAEEFVLFNDDQFVISSVKPSDFFYRGKPCDCAIMSPIKPERGGTAAIQINDMEIVNEHFNGFETVYNHKSQWFNIKYGFYILKTLLVLPWRTVFGYFEPHLPAAYLKSTFEEVWEKETNDLQETLNSRFKRKCDVNQWLMRYWQLSSGNFYPRSPKFGKYFDASNQLKEICSTIKHQKKKMICINDSNAIKNLELVKETIGQAFEIILPDKSKFEI